MINRWVEDDGLLDTLDGLGIGSIVFSPLAQGMLTDKYLATSRLAAAPARASRCGSNSSTRRTSTTSAS
jgi:aryl-alcohol dehydrogenase-like predicted oxidoreductase